jgi:hypothetical protein
MTPEAESSTAKKNKKKAKKPHICVFVTVEVAPTLYHERMPCSIGWTNVHLPTMWRLSYRRVPMPSVPWEGRERRREIT